MTSFSIVDIVFATMVIMKKKGKKIVSEEQQQLACLFLYIFQDPMTSNN